MSNLRQLIDKRNALVARERDVHAARASGRIGDAAEREQLERIERDLDAAHWEVEQTRKTEKRAGTLVRESIAARRGRAPKYGRQFDSFLRGVSNASWKFGEQRDLQADSDTAGGFLRADEDFLAELIQAVDDQVPLLALSNKHFVPSAESLGAPALSANPSNGSWTVELDFGSTEQTMAFGKRHLYPHPIAKHALISKTLLRASALAGEVVADRLAYALAVPLEIAFLNGHGAEQPLGIFTNSADGISTGQDITASSSAAILPDDCLEVKYGTKAQYWNRPNSGWIVSRTHHKDIRKAKDGNSNYLWSPGGFSNGLVPGSPDTMLERPVYTSEYAPVSTGSGTTSKTNARDGSTGALSGYTLCFGDYSLYWTATALDMEIEHLVELKAQTNQDVFVARAEIDGMPAIAEAFTRLRMKGY